MKRAFRLLASTSLLVMLLAASLLVAPYRGCSSLFTYTAQFRVTNATGKEIAVTSAHTQQTTRIPNQAAAVVPHGEGHITVKQRRGTIWLYRDVSPLDFHGTPYEIAKRYRIPCGGGTLTVNLLLEKDGRLYILLPNAKDTDAAKLNQPKGFPIKAEELKASSTEDAVQQRR